MLKKVKKIIYVLSAILLIVFIVRQVNGYIIYPENKDTFESKREMVSNKIEVVNKIKYKHLNGFHLLPKDKKTKGIIITFGGSEGSSLYSKSEQLCEEGYEVLSLYFFGKENQNKKIENIDISFFDEILEYLSENSIDSSLITVIGFSKGAELTLLLTQYYNQIDNIVLYSPTAYVYQGEFNGNSPWKFKGKSMKFFKYNDASLKSKIKPYICSIFKCPASYINIFESLSKNVGENDNRWIYKNKICGNILIFSGEDDQVWASVNDTKKLKKYDPEHIEAYIFKDAGHIFSDLKYLSNMKLGGNKVGNLKAKKESDEILIKKLNNWHKNKGTI